MAVGEANNVGSTVPGNGERRPDEPIHLLHGQVANQLAVEMPGSLPELAAGELGELGHPR
jgi:hypothetical protein